MPLARVRQPTEDIIDRVIQRLKIFSLCIVREVKPHKLPYPADPYFDVCDIKLKDVRDTDYVEEKFVSCLVLQRSMGNLTGINWMPSKGDLVMVAWLDNEKPIVLGQLYSIQQEAIVKPTSDDFYQDLVEKYTQPEPPDLDDELNPSYFPVPAETVNTTCQPICRKQFAGNRDQMQVWECPHGMYDDDPHCKDCKSTNYPTEGGVYPRPGAMVRYISKETYQPDRSTGRQSAKGEVARRFQFLHHSGSQTYFDETGDWKLNNAVAGVEKAHITAAPTGTLEGRSTPAAAADGSRWVMYGPTDATTDTYAKNASTTISAEIKDITTSASVKIYKNGAVRIANASEAAYITMAADGSIQVYSPETITITADEIDLYGSVYTE